MTGLTAALSALRKPVPAVLAAAGLFAGGVPGAPAGPGSPGNSRPGQASIYETGGVPDPGGVAVLMGGSGVAADAAERRPPRAPDSRGGDPRCGPSAGPAPASPIGSSHADAHIFAALAHARAGHDAAPSRGPPTLPL